MTRFFQSIFLLLILSCSDSINDKQVPAIQNDTIKPIDIPTEPIDTLTIIDDVVFSTNQLIAGNHLKYRTIDRKSKAGGFIYEYVDSNNQRLYFYSRRSGEMGATFLECYYNNNKPAYLIYAKYSHAFDTPYQNALDDSNRVYYCESYIIGNTLRDKIVEPLEENKVWSKGDISDKEQLIETIKRIEDDFENYTIIEHN